jgi:hypothetical protein
LEKAINKFELYVYNCHSLNATPFESFAGWVTVAVAQPSLAKPFLLAVITPDSLADRKPVSPASGYLALIAAAVALFKSA